MDREKLTAAVSRHLESDFGGEPGKKDALLLLAQHLDQLMNERLSGAAFGGSPAPSRGIDEATLRRVVREAVAEAMPSPAPAVDMAMMAKKAVDAALADELAAEVKKARTVAVMPWTAETYQIAAAAERARRLASDPPKFRENERQSPTHPSPGIWLGKPQVEPEQVEPTWPEAFGIAFRRIGSWFGLCERPEWR